VHSVVATRLTSDPALLINTSIWRGIVPMNA